MGETREGWRKKDLRGEEEDSPKKEEGENRRDGERRERIFY